MRIARQKLRLKLDELYLTYNRKRYVDPDPLLFLYNYPDIRDREIAGLIASSLAYGRVAMIMSKVSEVLGKLGPLPCQFIMAAEYDQIIRLFEGFKYRFAKGEHVCALVMGIQKILREYGSIGACFSAGLPGDTSVSNRLCRIRTCICRAGDVGHLLADPAKTSACKRSHLFLRWMIRKDEVDPGGWNGVNPSDLVYPLDTHMFKIGRLLGFTKRRTPDSTCARQITDGFRRINPKDPVKYDFCLTRFGIHQGFDFQWLEQFLKGHAPL